MKPDRTLQSWWPSLGPSTTSGRSHHHRLSSVERGRRLVAGFWLAVYMTVMSGAVVVTQTSTAREAVARRPGRHGVEAERESHAACGGVRRGVVYGGSMLAAVYTLNVSCGLERRRRPPAYAGSSAVPHERPVAGVQDYEG